MADAPAPLLGPAAVFDRAADTYDQVDVPWFGPIAQSLVQTLDPQPGERVLDLGCGRGAATLPLAEAVGPTGAVTAVDLAPRMVELLAADTDHLPQVEVRLGDVSEPELSASSYDVLVASLVLFFLPDPAAALARWVPLLVPGGRLGVSTFGAQDERWQAVDAVFRPYLPQQLLDARASGRTGPFGSDEGMEELLRGAGLVDVRTESSTVVARFRDGEHFLAWTWSHGQRVMWESVPEDRHAEVRAEVLSLAEAARDSGPADGIELSQVVRRTLGRRPA